jgi:hypothetical protein
MGTKGRELIGRFMKKRKSLKTKGLWLVDQEKRGSLIDKSSLVNGIAVSKDRKEEVEFVGKMKSYKLSKFLEVSSVENMIKAIIEEKDFLSNLIEKQWAEFIKMLFFVKDYKEEDLFSQYKQQIESRYFFQSHTLGGERPSTTRSSPSRRSPWRCTSPSRRSTSESRRYAVSLTPGPPGQLPPEIRQDFRVRAQYHRRGDVPRAGAAPAAF